MLNTIWKTNGINLNHGLSTLKTKTEILEFDNLFMSQKPHWQFGHYSIENAL